MIKVSDESVKSVVDYVGGVSNVDIIKGRLHWAINHGMTGRQIAIYFAGRYKKMVFALLVVGWSEGANYEELIKSFMTKCRYEEWAVSLVSEVVAEKMAA